MRRGCHCQNLLLGLGAASHLPCRVSLVRHGSQLLDWGVGLVGRQRGMPSFTFFVFPTRPRDSSAQDVTKKNLIYIYSTVFSRDAQSLSLHDEKLC